MQVLVAYGSRYGSTRETAEDIGRHLVSRGIDADVLDAADVNDLGGYDVAIVGSGIYAGLLRRRVVRLLHRMARQRASLPVAVFAMGPLAPESEKPGDWQSMRDRVSHVMDGIDGLNVVDTAVFGGAIDPERMNWMFSHMEAVDLRDPEVVTKWIDGVLASMRTPVRTGAE